MLDNQKSLAQKDFSEQRKSKNAEQFNYEGESKLPDNYGEKNILLINAMDAAMQEGHSSEYNEMIRKYFLNLQKIIQMNNYKNHILFILIFLSLVFSQKKNYKLTTDQKKIIKQAKTLEVSGLLNESKDIYLELLKEFPYLDEAIISVKNIALIDKSFENILPYANKYIEIHNYDESKLP